MADSAPPVLVWFRDDLRVADNPALTAAARDGRTVAALYVLEDASPEVRAPGGAARWWLHHSLTSLQRELGKLGVPLILKRGDARKVVPEIVRGIAGDKVFWNRRYGAASAVDDAVAAVLRKQKVEVATYAGSLLHEPGTVLKSTGGSYRVFSAFWRAALAKGEPRQPLPRPRRIAGAAIDESGDSIEAFDLRPEAPDWAQEIGAEWQPGEPDAQKRLTRFVDRIADYGRGRDLPGADDTSRLSPSLRFGEISPFQIWHASATAGPEEGRARTKFLSEIGWREFGYLLLVENPDMHRRNLRPEFDRLPWEEAYADAVWAWRRGRTGYPIVDAGMRQLWHSGWMHNRIRMVVASFLVKHLLFDWRLGEEWFWDTLVDADPASNPMNWQWVAGSGVEAQPFFRIFNPMLQGQKFDPDGTYVRRWVPELARMPSRHIHAPWNAPISVLNEAGVFVGIDYPKPMVDHRDARKRALAALAGVKGADSRS